MAVDLPPVGEVGLHDLGRLRKQSAQKHEVRISACVDDTAPHGNESARSRLRPACRRVVVALCAYPVECCAERGKTGRAQDHGGLDPEFEYLVKPVEFFMIPAMFE